jgi:hypothetical protein
VPCLPESCDIAPVWRGTRRKLSQSIRRRTISFRYPCATRREGVVCQEIGWIGVLTLEHARDRSEHGPTLGMPRCAEYPVPADCKLNDRVEHNACPFVF